MNIILTNTINRNLIRIISLYTLPIKEISITKNKNVLEELINETVLIKHFYDSNYHIIYNKMWFKGCEKLI